MAVPTAGQKKKQGLYSVIFFTQVKNECWGFNGVRTPSHYMYLQ